MGAAMEVAEAGFAKLEGEHFEYYMHHYSFTLGRNSKTSQVDIDLFDLGGGTNISRHHARIFYDFDGKCFALEVLGRNGCNVRGEHYYPTHPPVKLFSQDLIQIGELQFYFLLPSATSAKQIAPLALPGKRSGRRREEDFEVDELTPCLKKGRFQGNRNGLLSSSEPYWSVH